MGITYLCGVVRKDRAPEALVAHYFGGDLSKDLKRLADLSGWVYDPSLTEKKIDFIYNAPIEGRLLGKSAARASISTVIS